MKKVNSNEVKKYYEEDTICFQLSTGLVFPLPFFRYYGQVIASNKKKPMESAWITLEQCLKFVTNVTLELLTDLSESLRMFQYLPVGKYLFRVNNKDTRVTSL